MLLELCVTELEDVAMDTESGRNVTQPVVQESPHPYTDDTSLSGHVKIPGTIILMLPSSSVQTAFGAISIKKFGVNGDLKRYKNTLYCCKGDGCKQNVLVIPHKVCVCVRDNASQYICVPRDN